MKKKYIKPVIAVGVVVFLIVLFEVVGATEKLGRFVGITSSIVTNLNHAGHGDPRPLEEMSAEYIKANTGSIKDVNPKELPKAFLPLKKYGHPPFNMGACNVCHAPKRSKPAAITTKRVSELCYTCHEPKAEITTVLEGLDCNRCHSPHQSDRKKLIRKKVIERECPVGDFI